MKKRTILIVPPRGVPVKAIRIRLSVALIFFAIICSGFIGYFIPFDKITLSEIEKNQKKNLKEQNSALLQKILASLRLLNNLKEQVNRLEEKKGNIISKNVSDSTVKNRSSTLIDASRMETEDLIQYVNSREKRLRSFLTDASEDSNIFNILPVIAPVAEPYVISRAFGVSVDPFTGMEKAHYGIDFVAEKGNYIFATADGIIEKQEDHPLWGKRIIINHGDGITTVFAHVGSFKTNQGKRVSRGDLIGTIGISGLSSGPHLHYEIHIDGASVNPYDYMFPMITSKIALRLQ
ncbi:MAG TPA: M23 family metallopeptidase [Chitinispirillaceae bacterium]|nr:M23 family metallopeptidase [Chitinispirillaceae bacterium]